VNCCLYCAYPFWDFLCLLVQNSYYFCLLCYEHATGSTCCAACGNRTFVHAGPICRAARPPLRSSGVSGCAYLPQRVSPCGSCAPIPLHSPIFYRARVAVGFAVVLNSGGFCKVWRCAVLYLLDGGFAVSLRTVRYSGWRGRVSATAAGGANAGSAPVSLRTLYVAVVLRYWMCSGGRTTYGGSTSGAQA